MTDTIVVAGARIVDPATRTDRVGDLWVDARGVHDSRPAGFSEREAVDLAGKVVCPAFVEIHAHLREPGGEESETIATGCAAARAGGYGDVLAMANSPRTNDRPEVTAGILSVAAAQGGGVRVHPVSAATVSLAGKQPAPWREMVSAGCVAISDDGKPVADHEMLAAVLAATTELGVAYLSHAECPPHFHGPIHAGAAAQRFGVEGIPVECESDAVRAELDLARRTGGRIHVCHVSTRASLEAIAAARQAGLRVSCEATPHHLLLTDAAFLDRGPDPNFKMNPPLRPEADRAALQQAVIDGLVGSIATDHAPHAPRLKARGLAEAPFGVIGMETAFAVVHEGLVVRAGWDLSSLVRALTSAPAEAVGIRAGRLFEGPPRFTVLDPAAPWEVRPDAFASKSRNCPFAGQRGTGRVLATFLADRLVASKAPG